MNNGEGSSDSSSRPKPENYARALMKAAVSQICDSVGFHGSKQSALDALTDITIEYLSYIAKAAAFNSNLSGRTHCNVFDVVRALEDSLGSSLGVLGASGSENSCLLRSGLFQELVKFVGSSQEVPFFTGVPRFPVAWDRKLIPSFDHVNETPPGKHIPSWLPALPDPHTYVHTEVWSQRKADPREEKIEQARQRRKAEKALLNLQQRLLGIGLTAGASTSSGDGGNEVVKLMGGSGENGGVDGMEGHEEKGGPAVGFQEKSRSGLSIMEAFEPAIKAAKEGGITLDDVDVEKKLLPESRPLVNFKFKPGKKIFGESFDFITVRKGGRRTGPLLGRDDERDDKKRRVEYILRQSMENPQELIQS